MEQDNQEIKWRMNTLEKIQWKADSFLLSELNILSQRPGITENDLLYLQRIKTNLEEGVYSDVLFNALKDLAIMSGIGFAIRTLPPIAILGISVLQGDDPVLVATKSFGLQRVVSLTVPAVNSLYLVTKRGKPESPKEAAIDFAITLPRILPIPLPFYNAGMCILTSIALQEPEFKRLEEINLLMKN